jgi:hypothetical protein
MKNGKPTFTGLSLGFTDSSLEFPDFRFLNLNFLNSNQPVFGEPKKPVRTGFRRYCNPWFQCGSI